jgi:hypothetical protein
MDAYNAVGERERSEGRQAALWRAIEADFAGKMSLSSVEKSVGPRAET